MTTTPTQPDPWAPLRILRDVVLAAPGWRCQCTGACGHVHHVHLVHHVHHVAGRGRRSVTDGPRHPLIAAPAQPGIPAHQAAALAGDELRAWCPPCHRAAAAVTRGPVADPGSVQPDLFGGDAA